MKIQNLPRYALTMGLLALGGVQAAQADLLVYEGFQYGPAAATRTGAALLQGQPTGSVGEVDAIGLGGTYNDLNGPGANTDLFMYDQSLSFIDLPTAGNSVRSDTNNNSDRFERSITADLDAGPELWFSFLANKLQNNFSAAEGGIVIGNQVVNNSRVLEDSGSTGLQGFGIAPTTSGNNWTAYAWNGSSQFDSGGVYTVPVDGTQTNLLIGHVSFGTGTGGTDEYSVYYYDTAAVSVIADISNLNQIGSTIEVNVDETTLDTLSLTRQVNTAYDEIRIATSFEEVIGIPEPASLILIGIGSTMILARRRR